MDLQVYIPKFMQKYYYLACLFQRAKYKAFTSKRVINENVIVGKVERLVPIIIRWYPPVNQNTTIQGEKYFSYIQCIEGTKIF